MSKRAIRKIRSTMPGWAIETGLASEPYLLRGLAAALYRTRAAVRADLDALKLGYRLPRKARAVRVAVTVTTIGRG